MIYLLAFIGGIITCFIGLYILARRRNHSKKTKSGPNSTQHVGESVSAVKNPGTNREDHVS